MTRPFLRGHRVRLVGLEKHHLVKRVEFINDLDVQQTLNFDYPTTHARTEAWFTKNVIERQRVDFAIETLTDTTVIGFCGFMAIEPKAKKAEHYIMIGDTTYWGHGYGREAYKLLTNYGFLELGLQRVYGFQIEGNERARKAIARLGWTTEGFLRNDLWSHGVLKSRYLISILRDEWEANPIYDDV